MSCYEWETATIILPTAEVAPLKKTLREALNERHEHVRAAAVRLHKSVGTRSLAKYRVALSAKWVGANDEVVHDALYVLTDIVGRAERSGAATVCQPTVADVERVAPRASNRTTVFPVGTDASIAFEGRKLHWSVPENNHAVDNAHEQPLARLLFGRLARVVWSRGTGGWGVGNNEYSNNGESGGGANQTSFTYGPLGEQQQAHEAGMSLAAWRKVQAEAERRDWFGPGVYTYARRF